MNIEEKISLVESDKKKGFRLKSINRLKNLINQNQNDLILRKKLGDLYFECDILDAAGLYWFLIEPQSKDMTNCVNLYKESISNKSIRILHDIKFKGDIEEIGEYAKNTLISLEEDCRMNNHVVPDFRKKGSNHEKSNSETVVTRVTGGIFKALILLIPILAIIGIISIIRWIF